MLYVYICIQTCTTPYMLSLSSSATTSTDAAVQAEDPPESWNPQTEVHQQTAPPTTTDQVPQP